MSTLRCEWLASEYTGDAERGCIVELADERALLRRLVAGLGMRVVALADSRQLVVSNPSMRLTADEVPVLARVACGG